MGRYKSVENFASGHSQCLAIHEAAENVWIKNAFAIMHNSCTSALEVTIQKPLVTFIPYKQKYNPTLEMNWDIKLVHTKN